MSENIAVMHCRKIGRDCTGSGCFSAFYEHRGSFSAYQGKDIRIVAFFDCSGCDADKFSDPDFLKKENRLKELNLRCLHLATCCTHHCPQLAEIQASLEQAGIPVVVGSH